MERMGVDVTESLKERTARLLATECVGRGAWHDLVIELSVALLQAREDAKAAAKRAVRGMIVDAGIADELCKRVDFVIDHALKSARQAEPQEGEKG